MPARIFTLFLLLSATVGHAGTIAYRVGSDVACDTSSIQTALDMAAMDSSNTAEIFIARNATYQQVALQISAENTVLRGGYDTCTDGVPSGRTTISGAGGSLASVITISGAAADVTLANLSITGGDPGAGNFGGGIQIIGTGVLRLTNTSLSGNSSQRGGAIYFDGSGLGNLAMDASTQVFSNSADFDGGGIYCKGATVIAEGDIFNNSATFGGGVYADGCDFRHMATVQGDGIFLNSATNSGGGAYLANSSALRLSGIPDATVGLYLNTATNDGGGVYIADANSRLSSLSGSIVDNSAVRGGAVFMADGEVFMDAAFDCALQRCSVLSDNAATGEGGAVYQLAGYLSIRRTYAFDNASPDGSLIKSEGGETDFSSTMIYGNRNATAVLRLKNGDHTIQHSTLTQNQDQNNTILMTGGSLTLQSSILWETGSGVLDFFGAATTQEYDCLLVSSFPFVVMQPDIIFDPPQFRDAPGEDFHLLRSSPAVDFCFNVSGPPVRQAQQKIVMEVGGIDIDGSARGEDLPDVVNQFGPFDMGADEYSETVFQDGFESLLIW